MSKKKSRKNKKSRKKQHPVITFISSAVIVVIVGYIGVASYLFFNQRKFLYYPPSNILNTAEQTIEIVNVDITLRGWIVNENQQNAILYFAGNAEHPEANIIDFKLLFPNYTLYFINYRGYGESDGSPTEEALYSDAVAIYDYIIKEHNHVIVIGRSLGSGIATYLAVNRSISGLILIEPYDSLVNIAQNIYSIFPMGILMKDKFDSASRVSEITVATLIIKAENDEVIPNSSTDKLIACFQATEPEVVTVLNANHNNIQDYTQYYQFLRGFASTIE